MIHTYKCIGITHENKYTKNGTLYSEPVSFLSLYLIRRSIFSTNYSVRYEKKKP